MAKVNQEFVGFKASKDFVVKLIALCDVQGKRLGKKISKSELMRLALEAFARDEHAQLVDGHTLAVEAHAAEIKESYRLLQTGRREFLHYCFDILLEQEKYVSGARKTLNLGLRFDRRLPHGRLQIEAAAFLISELTKEILALDDEVRPLLDAQEKEKSENAEQG